MQKFNILSRRSFLDRSVKTGAALALSTLVDIPFVIKRALAEGSIGLNGKKLLFIWLRGANDGLNSVIPIQDPAYATSRPTLAIPKDPGTDYTATNIAADFPINTLSTDPTYSYASGIRLGNGFAALHPSLKFLAPVYNDGDLALIHRVAYPKQSRSHFDSQRYWENGNPNNNLVQDGIFYRTILESGLANAPGHALTGVSVQSALPLILRGEAAAMTNLTDPTRYDLLGIPNDVNGNAKAANFLNAANTDQFPSKLSRELLQLQYANMVDSLSVVAQIDFSESGNTYRDSVITDNDTDWATANGSEGYYLFPTTNVKNGGWRRPDGTNVFNKYAVDPSLQGLFTNLKAAALVLNKTDAIVAGTEYGGFDTHQRQGTLTGTHPTLNRGIGWALYALKRYFTRYADKATWSNVVVVTLSEFGRTTIENSDLGTDHAEAGVMFVAGGAVKGYNKGNVSGVFNCGTSGVLPWVPGSAGTMFGVGGRYVKRNTDYRSVLGEVIRKHLGATSDQVKRIIPGYAKEPELANQATAGASSVDGTPILGEVGIL